MEAEVSIVPYKQCRFCANVFASSYALAHHMRRDHGLWQTVRGGVKMRCVCGTIFKDVYRLCRHLRELPEESFADHVLESRLR